MTENDPTPPATATPANNVVPLPAAAAEQRPSEKIVAFVKRHPVLTVAGAVGAGLAVSALLPRKSGRRIFGKALDLAEAAGAATMIFGREASEKAQNVSRDARKQASLLGHRAERAGHDTALQLEKYGLAALAAAGALGRASAARAGKLSEATVETTGKVGEIATERSRRMRALSDHLRHRLMH